ncbi:MAG: hypothetical protein JOZ82_07740 [Marmoricola sp.]|nr:hypothetical protein [Marmoricola sp.]
MRLPEDSIAGLETEHQGVRAVWTRRVVVSLIAVLVLAGLAGYAGDKVGTRTTHAPPWSVQVQYPRVSRPGLDVPWQVTVRHEGGFKGQLQLAVTASYFDIFESQGFDPEPTNEAADGSTLYLSFNPPPSGDTFVLSFDAYIQPTSQQGQSGSLSVVDHGQRVATTHFTTTLLP